MMRDKNIKLTRMLKQRETFHFGQKKKLKVFKITLSLRYRLLNRAKYEWHVHYALML